MFDIIFNEERKELPIDQLRDLFISAHWSDGSETEEMITYFNLPFINSTMVVSAWYGDRLVGVVRVLSDKIIRSTIHDLVVDPDFQRRGIGRELLARCIRIYPKTEWIVQTNESNVQYYLKNGFSPYSRCVLFKPSIYDREYSEYSHE
ncbi:MAG: GNAT family N-acetyltransferase [Methanobacteriota archaeon]